VRLLVDGMNVIGTRPDGWWRDRPGARRRLVGQLARLVAGGDDVMVVFDGRAADGEVEAAEASGVTALFAPGGPNAADHAIVGLLRAIEHPEEITVVTSDAALAERARRTGASVEGSSALWRRLERSGGSGGTPESTESGE